MVVKSMQENCICESFCLTIKQYWVPKGQNPEIIELYNSVMELHNSIISIIEPHDYLSSSIIHYEAPLIIWVAIN